MKVKAAVEVLEGVPPMTTAGVVVSRVHPQLGSRLHIVNDISDFLDYSGKCTLENASKAVFLSLLRRLRNREWYTLSQEFRQAQRLNEIRNAATKGQVMVLKWWYNDYKPNAKPKGLLQAIMRVAAFLGHLNILNGGFFQGEQSIQMLESLDPPLICQHPEIVRWIRSQSQCARLLVVMDKAMKRGDLEFIKWVECFPIDEVTAIYSHNGARDAAEAGQLEVLQ